VSFRQTVAEKKDRDAREVGDEVAANHDCAPLTALSLPPSADPPSLNGRPASFALWIALWIRKRKSPQSLAKQGVGRERVGFEPDA
jgi:hypothetical protein